MVEVGPREKFDLSQIKYHHARYEDAEEMLKVILDAYIIEVGDTGIAFKTKNRYLSIDQLKEDIRSSIEVSPETGKPKAVFLNARLSDDLTSPIVGCIRGVFLVDEKDGVLVNE